MLDWGGAVVKEFGYTKGVANIYVIDRRGGVMHTVSGPFNDDAFRPLIRAINRALDGAPAE